MEILPNIVINNIMLFLSHPTADIIKDSMLFDFMAIKIKYHMKIRRGSAFNCGFVDGVHPHRFSDPEHSQSAVMDTIPITGDVLRNSL